LLCKAKGRLALRAYQKVVGLILLSRIKLKPKISSFAFWGERRSPLTKVSVKLKPKISSFAFWGERRSPLTKVSVKLKPFIKKAVLDKFVLVQIFN